MKAFTMSKGFSLVELMVVIAIIALLAAVAIPSYKEYTNRAKMADINNVIGRQLDVWAEKYTLGKTTAPISMASPPTGVTSIVLSFVGDGAVNANRVVVTMNGTTLPFLGGNTVITYTPNVSSTNVISWTCAYTAGNSDLSNYLTTCTYT